MFLTTIVVLLGTGLTVDSERHSLHYIYTALSRNVKMPGIHEFTAMGMLDNTVIDYFDSDRQVKFPKQKWMKAELKEDYWKKGTESRQSKQQWFKVNIEILMKRLNQSHADTHVLQWMHGCEADSQPDGSFVFHKGIDMYSYDGQNFLFFDDENQVWVASVTAAKATKMKWDNVSDLRKYTMGYLENECMEWMNTFLRFQRENGTTPVPDVFLFAGKSKVEENIILTCMATGFSSLHTVLQMKRNGRILSKEDGVESSGVRPNGDDTYQIRDHVEIFKSDESTYTCEVIDVPSKLHLHKVWDRRLPADPTNVIVIVMGAVGIGALLLAVLLLLQRGIMKSRKSTASTSDSGSFQTGSDKVLLGTDGSRSLEEFCKSSDNFSESERLTEEKEEEKEKEEEEEEELN